MPTVRTATSTFAGPGARCGAYLAKLEGRDFASLLATHTADHEAALELLEDGGRAGKIVLTL